MKKTTVLKEIRETSSEELQGRLDRQRGELFKSRMSHATKQLKNVMQIRQLKKEIAQTLTVLAQRGSSSTKSVGSK